MPITINVPTILQSLTNNQKRIDASGDNVQEVINHIESQYPGFKARIIKEGKVHRFMNIYINDDDIRFSDNLETSVSDSDSITILPAVAGGSYHFVFSRKS